MGEANASPLRIKTMTTVALTEQDLRAALPPALKSAATPALLAKVNAIVSDPLELEAIRENFVTYTGVLSSGNYKIDDYINAVKYVSYKLMGNSNQDAWIKTFPKRHQALVAAGHGAKGISSHVAMYNKGKLVNAIMEQSIIPSWVLNQDKFQEAINIQFDLAQNAQSEKVRSDAANSLLTHLAKPRDVAGVNINIDTVGGKTMDQLRETLNQMSAVSRQLIGEGVDIKAVAAHRIIEHEDDE